MKSNKILTAAERQRIHRQNRTLAGFRLIRADITPVATEALDLLVPDRYTTISEAVSVALCRLAENHD